MQTLRQWLRFPRSLPEYEGMHEIRVIIRCYAAYPCDDIPAAADEPGICLHFIPPGLTDIPILSLYERRLCNLSGRFCGRSEKSSPQTEIQTTNACADND
jgi:hypothetical protein